MYGTTFGLIKLSERRWFAIAMHGTVQGWGAPGLVFGGLTRINLEPLTQRKAMDAMAAWARKHNKLTPYEEYAALKEAAEKYAKERGIE